MEEDIEYEIAQTLCRVCEQEGTFELNKNKFCFNGVDVTLMTAFNSFSKIENTNDEVFLCSTCTESLTIAYSFWEEVKNSDRRLILELETRTKSTESLDEIDDETPQFTATDDVVKDFKLIETVNDDGSMVYELIQVEDSISVDAESSIVKENLMHEYIIDPLVSGTKRPKRPRKSKNATKTSEIIINQGNYQNMALPQFTFTNNQQSDVEEDESGGKLYLDDSEDVSPRQNVKTMSVSAIKWCDGGTEMGDSYLQHVKTICATPSDDNNSVYKCKHCPKAFSSPYHLMIHTRKSHVCQHCLEAFEKPADLYKHVKEKHNKFDCLVCGRVFRSNSNLRQHMRKIHRINLPAHVSLLEVKEETDTV